MEWKVSSWKRITSIKLWGEEEIPLSAVEIGFHTKTQREINSPWDAARSIHRSMVWRGRSWGGRGRGEEGGVGTEEEEQEEVDEATEGLGERNGASE